MKIHQDAILSKFFPLGKFLYILFQQLSFNITKYLTQVIHSLAQACVVQDLLEDGLLDLEVN